MKQVTYVPSACKGDDATFEGSVTLRLPTFDEKYEYLERIGITIDDEGKVDLGDKKNRLRLMREMVKASSSHYLEVKLKNKATGEELKSFEDMSYEPLAYPILTEVAPQLLNGFSVGNG